MTPVTMRQARRMYRRARKADNPIATTRSFRAWARDIQLPTRRAVEGVSGYWKINDIVSAGVAR